MKTASILLLCILAISSSITRSTDNNPPEVEGWYFRAISGYPAAITFKPVVLFKDGTYFLVNEEPTEDLDVFKSRIDDKSRWGKWQRNKDLFTLTNAEGKIKEYDLRKGNWFPAFPFDDSISLKGKYKKVSGGVYSNSVLALFQSEIVFLGDSHFTNSEDGGITAYSSNAWKTSKNSGTYEIYDNTIILNYNQSDKVRLSFAIGAKGYDTIDTDMIFIGGKAYVKE